MLFNEGEDVRFQGTDEDGLVHVLCCGCYRVVVKWFYLLKYVKT
jgi:hypothetical protein